MNTSPDHGSVSDTERCDSLGAGEDTLRLIAGLPAPAGLADRVQAGLRSAPQASQRLLWRFPMRPAGGWIESAFMRAAAAAAIVCVVAGGGWQIYSRVQFQAQPVPAARVVGMPAPSAPAGSGFSQSNARRVPQTLVGPVLIHPVKSDADAKAADKPPASSKAGGAAMKKKKTRPRPAATPLH